MKIKVFIKIVYVWKIVIYTKYTIHTRFIINTRNIHETYFDSRNTYKLQISKHDNKQYTKILKFYNHTHTGILPVIKDSIHTSISYNNIHKFISNMTNLN